MRYVLLVELRMEGSSLNNKQQTEKECEYIIEIRNKKGINISVTNRVTKQTFSVDYPEFSDLYNADEIISLLLKTLLVQLRVSAYVKVKVPEVVERYGRIYTDDAVLEYHCPSLDKPVECRIVKGRLLSSTLKEDDALVLPSILGDEAPGFMYEVLDILNGAALERIRQVEGEGMLPANDVKYTNSELLSAAICYIQGTSNRWPWDMSWFKPTTEERNLIKGIALIVAHIQAKRKQT